MPDQDDIWREAYRAGQEAMRERCAGLAEEFSWALPLADDRAINEAVDDAACEVCRQVAKAIRTLEVSHGE